ncbi:MAG: toll/interleukin-1 receptor domain-containing protein [Pseudomonadota bacterium]
MSEVFISYSHSDTVIAEAIAGHLTALGVDVWWDQALEGGEQFRGRIEQAINSSEVTLVLWSRNSTGSQWVIGEAGAANDLGRLIPVAVDITQPPLDFRSLHTIDLQQWNPGDALPAALLTAVGSRLGRELSYGSAMRQRRLLDRAAAQLTRAWYQDLESILYLLIAQGFACFLMLSTFIYVLQEKFPDDVTALGQAFGFGFALIAGMISAPLVMGPVLINRRLLAAAFWYAVGASIAIPTYYFTSLFMEHLRYDTFAWVGPSVFFLLLLMTLGARAARR